MRALVFQHMDHDHPGRFMDYFAEDEIMTDVVRLFEGESIPSMAPYDLLVVLGGAQDAWQESEYPYLAEEKNIIRDWVKLKAKPYLGICLGHQLLGSALGSEVAPASSHEVGVFEIALTDAGHSHPLLSGLPPISKVMQWHFAEVRTVPPEAKVLASSATTPIQAMAVGNHAISTQFHCEFSPQTVAGWRSIPSYVSALERIHGPGAYDRLRTQCMPLMPEMQRTTRQMWDNFKRVSGLIA